MYIFFSQSPSLSRPLLHTCIFSILSGTSEKTTSLIRFTQSHLFFSPFLLFHSSLTGLYCLSLSLSSAAFFRNSSLQQTALSRNQQFCLREFRIKAITEPNRMKHSHQISHLSEGLAFSQTDSDFELLCITDMFLLSFTLFTVSKKES